MSKSGATRLLSTLLFLGMGAAPLAQAADLTTTAGYAEACAPGANKAAPTTNEARITAVICRDTALVRQIVTFVDTGFKRIKAENTKEDAIKQEIIKEVDYVIAELGATRKLLDQIQLGKKASLRIAPGQWELDLDSDGKVELWEKYLFAIPKRNGSNVRFGMPSNDQAYYDREYNVNAVIHVDQADILWSLSYHNFIEGLLTNVRAFDFERSVNGLTLARPAMLKTAHQLIGRGIELSGKMRELVLAETDDDEEWIGNTKQQSSVFPIALDEADFATWGSIMKQLSAVWQGKTLLPTTTGGRGLLAEIAPVCPAGSGLNISKVYLQPPAAGTVIPFSRVKLPTHHCEKIDAKHAISPLPELIEQAAKSEAGMGMLRYLYWTN